MTHYKLQGKELKDGDILKVSDEEAYKVEFYSAKEVPEGYSEGLYLRAPNDFMHRFEWLFKIDEAGNIQDQNASISSKKFWNQIIKKMTLL